MQRICIFGAGAIGSLLTARLSSTDHQISCVARGQHLEAMQQQGLRLRTDGRDIHCQPNCTDNPADLGAQDVVFLTLKAHDMQAAVDGIRPLLGKDTAVVTMHNGLPWWYFFADSSGFGEHHLQSVDPGGLIWKGIGPERALGAVVYPAAEILEPGVVQHVSGNRLTMGEPSGARSNRLAHIEKALLAGGFEISPSDALRQEIWLKLSVNAAINPLTVVHQLSVAEVLADSRLRQTLVSLIGEVQEVAASVGVSAMMPPADLADALNVVGHHKTSMLRDFEQGKTLELAALTGAVLEIAETTGVAAPGLVLILDRVEALLSVRDRSGESPPSGA